MIEYAGSAIILLAIGVFLVVLSLGGAQVHSPMLLGGFGCLIAGVVFAALVIRSLPRKRFRTAVLQESPEGLRFTLAGLDQAIPTTRCKSCGAIMAVCAAEPSRFDSLEFRLLCPRCAGAKCYANGCNRMAASSWKCEFTVSTIDEQSDEFPHPTTTTKTKSKRNDALLCRRHSTRLTVAHTVAAPFLALMLVGMLGGVVSGVLVLNTEAMGKSPYVKNAFRISCAAVVGGIMFMAAVYFAARLKRKPAHITTFEVEANATRAMKPDRYIY